MFGKCLRLLIIGLFGWYFYGFISELYEDRYWIRTLNDILIPSWLLAFFLLLFIYLQSEKGWGWLRVVPLVSIFCMLLFLMAALHGNMAASARYNTTLMHTQYLIEDLEEYHSEHNQYPDNIDSWMCMPFYQWISYGGTKRYPFYRNYGNQYILTIEQPDFNMTAL